MRNKKALSDVVATVLIVLLALAAVAIVWSFINPALERSGSQLSDESLCLNIEVKPLSCRSDGASGWATTIEIAKGLPNKVTAVIEDGQGDAVSKTFQGAPPLLPIVELGTIPISFASGELPANMDYTTSKLKAAAVVRNSAGKDVTCGLSPTIVVCA